MKIQLEYDLLSGQFLHIHTGPGKQHDQTYGSSCVPTVKANDLCIRDLGYFHLKDLQHIHDKKAYYISRFKSNTHIYQKNLNPGYFQDGRIKKGTQYIQLDMEKLMNSMQPGQTYEITDAYVGMIFSRFFLKDKTNTVKLLIIHGCLFVILHKTIDNNSLSYRWICIHLALSFSYPRVTDAF